MPIICPDPLGGLLLRQALNPATSLASIICPSLAEQHFEASGDAENAALSRRLLVQNRISVSFHLLFERTLFDFLHELETSWLERGRGTPQTFPHASEDYDSASSSFAQAAAESADLADISPELCELIDLARLFPNAACTLPGLRSWTASAQDLFRGRTDLPAVAAVLVGARVLWKMEIRHGSFLELRSAADALKRNPMWSREEGFIRYTAALAVLLNRHSDAFDLNDALEELKEAIQCFRRLNAPFPRILLTRLGETHEELGRAHFERRDLLAAGHHFQEARLFEGLAREKTLPVARALPKKVRKSGWREALRSLIGG